MKPENILFLPSADRFYLIDYGLSKRYVDLNGKHIPQRSGKSFRGTLRYCSINMHLSQENSRRDDLESLAYVLIYLANGVLPWMNSKGKTLVEKFEVVRNIKTHVSPGKLCAGLDKAVFDLLHHARSLRFDQQPDYEGLRNSFNDGLKRINSSDDGNYCWNEQTLSSLVHLLPNQKDDSVKVDKENNSAKNDDIHNQFVAEQINAQQAAPAKQNKIVDQNIKKEVKKRSPSPKSPQLDPAHPNRPPIGSFPLWGPPPKNSKYDQTRPEHQQLHRNKSPPGVDKINLNSKKDIPVNSQASRPNTMMVGLVQSHIDNMMVQAAKAGAREPPRTITNKPIR